MKKMKEWLMENDVKYTVTSTGTLHINCFVDSSKFKRLFNASESFGLRLYISSFNGIKIRE